MDELKKGKVAALIVTYNRKAMLNECLGAVLSQTRPVDAVYIIDNTSTDGTPGDLVDKGFIDQELYPAGAPVEQVKIIPSPRGPENPVAIHYVRMHENAGGAGGFHEGISRCYDAGFDWFWMMDDDGYADENALSRLLESAEKNNLLFCGPLAVDREDAEALAFRPNSLRHVKNSAEAIKADATDGVIYDWITPFNGTLVSRKVIDKVGNIKKEMFIWGDEREYELRVQANGIRVGTIISAKHRHPARQGKRVQIMFGLFGRIIVRPADKVHIYYRNLGYLTAKYYGRKMMLKTLIRYTTYYLLNLRLDVKGLTGFYRYFIDGATDRYRLPPKRKD